MTFKTLAYSALAAVMLSGMAATGASAAQINFDQNNGINPSDPNNQARLNYNGQDGVGTLNGDNIRFDSIALQGGANPPAGNETSLFCRGCMLDFSTGPNTSEDGNTWTFASGGSFVLTGTAEDSNGNTVAGNTGPLLTGSFEGTPTVSRFNDDSFNFVSNGTDQKDPALLTYFGLDPASDFTFANTEISLNSAQFDEETGAISGEVTGADINNSSGPANNNVPEPEELGIFGLGLALLLIGVFSRRRFGNELS